jgi:hypothetical protein
MARLSELETSDPLARGHEAKKAIVVPAGVNRRIGNHRRVASSR